MVPAQAADVYLEKLEEDKDPVQESDEMWNRETTGMAMGKYPQGLLAHIQQLDTLTGIE